MKHSHMMKCRTLYDLGTIHRPLFVTFPAQALCGVSPLGLFVTSPGSLRMGMAGHVVEVMNGIVDKVAAERLHGEGGAVTAAARARPLVAGNGGEAVGDGSSGRDQFLGHPGRFLQVV